MAVLKIHYQSPLAHYGLGVVHRKRGHLLSALDHYRASLALDSSGKKGHVWNNLGQTLALLGRPEEGLAFLGHASALVPQDEKLRRDVDRARLSFERAQTAAGKGLVPA